VLVDDFVTLDADIDGGHGFESFDDGFDEERHEAELDAVFGDEAVLQFLAQIHDGGHVALVEGGEEGSGLLSADELVSDLRRSGDIFFRVTRPEVTAGLALGERVP
jgi:hypothetical protein